MHHGCTTSRWEIRQTGKMEGNADWAAAMSDSILKLHSRGLQDWRGEDSQLQHRSRKGSPGCDSPGQGLPRQIRAGRHIFHGIHLRERRRSFEDDLEGEVRPREGKTSYREGKNSCKRPGARD